MNLIPSHRSLNGQVRHRSHTGSRVSRRQWLTTSGLATGTVFSAGGMRGLWADEPAGENADEQAAEQDKTSANDRIRLAAIGVGGKGRHNIHEICRIAGVDVVAVADVDAAHQTLATDLLRELRPEVPTQAMADYRECLHRDDIDGVIISTPDHWHALATIEACMAGKDVYCEKPLGNSVAETTAMVDAVSRYDRVLQCGSHERSNSRIRWACEQIRDGLIGKVLEVRVNMPTDQDHHRQVAQYGAAPSPTRPPATLDYDRWLGPASAKPHIADRVHFWWRFVLEHGGGEMTDRGAHILDLVGLALDRDDSPPVRYMAVGNQPESNRDGVPPLYDAFMDYVFVNEYADGLRITGVDDGRRGIEFIGEGGRIFIHIHGGKLEVEPAGLVDEAVLAKAGSEDGPLGRTKGHHANFIDCMRSRETPLASAQAGHNTALICHLNNIAMRVGRPIQWDPQQARILDDAEANRWLSPPMRAGYGLPAIPSDGSNAAPDTSQSASTST